MKQASRNQSYVAPPPQPYSAGPYYGPSPYSAQPPNQLWDWRDYFVSNYTSTYKNTFKLESSDYGCDFRGCGLWCCIIIQGLFHSINTFESILTVIGRNMFSRTYVLHPLRHMRQTGMH